MDNNKHANLIKRFLKDYEWNNILALANEYPDTRSLIVNYMDIERFDRNLAKEFLEHPDGLLEAAEDALRKIDLPVEKVMDQAHIRIINVPNRIPIQHLRSKHLGQLVSLEGLVRKATETRPRVTKAAFQCLRCGHITIVDQTGPKFEEPFGGCEEETCGKKGPFKVLIEDSTFVDAQKLQIQEPPEALRGTQAQSIDADIDDDLAGLCIPGERVIINGILKSRQRTMRDGKSTFYDLVLEGNSIERLEAEFDELDISPEDEELILQLARNPDIHDLIVSSIAPTVYGMEDVKEALALLLFSGISKPLPDGTKIRDTIHLLLIGDPGKAKSRLLKYIQLIAPRAVFTSGKNTTAGGLIASAVKDDGGFGDGRWTIEGGALVIADKGVAIIDEMDKTDSKTLDSMHDAMEQQEVGIAKAGLLVTLKTRCAIIGACNPKYGKFDRYESIADQITMPPALLSRFDLIFVLLDTPDEYEDGMVSRQILQNHRVGSMLQQRDRQDSGIPMTSIESESKAISSEVPPALFRKYVACARRISPIPTPHAEDRIHNYYLQLRQASAGSKIKNVPVTPRQEEALIRMAEASARIRLSTEYTVEDVDRAIRLMQTCINNIGIDVWNTGVSDVQRDGIKTIRDIIKDRSSGYSNGHVPILDIINQAQLQGISRERAEGHLMKMKKNGNLYSIDHEHVKLVVN